MKKGFFMSKKIYLEKRELRKDGLINFIYLIEGDRQELPGTEITIGVHGRWYDEEIMKIGKLDFPQSKSIGILLRYIAREAQEQYDKFTSGDDDTTYREIPPDRWVDFNEIIMMARERLPKVILPDSFSQD